MKTIEERFEHFNTRLMERYGFEISIDMWKLLRIKQAYYKTSKHSLFCSVDIGDKEVIGIMQVGRNGENLCEGNFMRTVLPYDNTIGTYPIPWEIKKEMRRSVFGEICMQQLNFALELSKLSLEARELFTKYPYHIAHKAKYKTNNDHYNSTRFTRSVAMQLFPDLFPKKA